MDKLEVFNYFYEDYAIYDYGQFSIKCLDSEFNTEEFPLEVINDEIIRVIPKDELNDFGLRMLDKVNELKNK